MFFYTHNQIMNVISALHDKFQLDPKKKVKDLP